MRDFQQDRSPAALARTVDRLLSRPEYGEQWGRHWLDLVRYAETNGYERDGPKENAWRYRDYVIAAFNAGKPYDRFVCEQLAGDELPDRDSDSLIATGYYRLGLWDDEPVDPVQAYYDSLDDVVSTTSLVFMATTVGCARCHDHKIDPIPQRDYYQMMAFFHNIYQDIRQLEYKKTAFTLNTQTVVATPAELEEYEASRARHQAALDSCQHRVDQLEELVYQSLSNPEKEDARDERTRRHLIETRAASVLDPAQHAELTELRDQLRQLKRAGVQPLPRDLDHQGKRARRSRDVRPGSRQRSGPR